MKADEQLDMTDVVKGLVNEGLRFIVYVGDQDYICNWFGQKVSLEGSTITVALICKI